MRLNKNSISKVALTDLLRRKQSSLEKFLTENGIVTYERLVSRCESIGVVPPSEDQFNSSMGNPYEYSSPTEGIVVLNPLPSSPESTGSSPEDGSVSNEITEIQEADESIDEATPKKKRKKTTSES